MNPLTVGDLIAKLEKLDRSAVAWMFTGIASPVYNVIASTTADPVTGRHAGDPAGSPVAMLTCEERPKLRKGETLA
jgi:hypothetical protein